MRVTGMFPTGASGWPPNVQAGPCAALFAGLMAAAGELATTPSARCGR